MEWARRYIDLLHHLTCLMCMAYETLPYKLVSRCIRKWYTTPQHKLVCMEDHGCMPGFAMLTATPRDLWILSPKVDHHRRCHIAHWFQDRDGGNKSPRLRDFIHKVNIAGFRLTPFFIVSHFAHGLLPFWSLSTASNFDTTSRHQRDNYLGN